MSNIAELIGESNYKLLSDYIKDSNLQEYDFESLYLSLNNASDLQVVIEFFKRNNLSNQVLENKIFKRLIEDNKKVILYDLYIQGLDNVFICNYFKRKRIKENLSLEDLFSENFNISENKYLYLIFYDVLLKIVCKLPLEESIKKIHNFLVDLFKVNSGIPLEIIHKILLCMYHSNNTVINHILLDFIDKTGRMDRDGMINPKNTSICALELLRDFEINITKNIEKKEKSFVVNTFNLKLEPEISNYLLKLYENFYKDNDLIRSVYFQLSLKLWSSDSKNNTIKIIRQFHKVLKNEKINLRNLINHIKTYIKDIEIESANNFIKNI